MSPQNTTTSLATNKPQEIVKDEPLAAYLRRPEIVEKFTLVCGNEREAMRSIQSVILVVETAEPGDYSLQKCSHRSIVRAALRAATQHVSVDPVDREAYLVPRKVKRIDADGREVKVLEACFQFHYQEILNRALRTNRYTVINVSPIFEGTEIFENIYTGLHVLKTESGLTVSNESAGALRSWNDRDGKKRIGWLGYYRTVRGQEKTVYMSISDIEQRVPVRNSFGWRDFREAMERKTVLLDLLRKADLKAVEMQAVKSALDDIDNAESDETSGGPDLAALDALEGHAEEIKAEIIGAMITTAQPEMDEAEARYIDAGEVLTPKGARLADCTDEVLKVAAKSANHPEVAKAAQERLDYRAAKTGEIERNISELY